MPVPEVNVPFNVRFPLIVAPIFPVLFQVPKLVIVRSENVFTPPDAVIFNGAFTFVNPLIVKAPLFPEKVFVPPIILNVVKFCVDATLQDIVPPFIDTSPVKVFIFVAPPVNARIAFVPAPDPIVVVPLILTLLVLTVNVLPLPILRLPRMLKVVLGVLVVTEAVPLMVKLPFTVMILLSDFAPDPEKLRLLYAVIFDV
jgi:hypothetical protein